MRERGWPEALALVLAVALAACSSDGGPGTADLRGDLAEVGAADLPVLPDGRGSDLVPELAAEVVPELPSQLTIEGGDGLVVEVTANPFGLVARRGGEVVWDGSDLPLLVGRVAVHDPDKRYDPELVLPEVEWLGLEAAVAYDQPEEGAHRLWFEPLPDRRIGVTLRPGGEGIVTVEVAPEEWRDEVLTAVEYAALDGEENFYGLGESFDHVARRGTIRQMHMTLDLTQESGYNEAHYPIPLLISTHGSGIFVEDRHPGFFDVCHGDPDRVVVRFSTGTLRFHLLGAATPLDVLRRYVALTGKPALPPSWAFGVVQWEDEIDGQAQVMENAEAMREHDLPCSAMWIDRPFATAHESFIFDPAKYPDSKKMVEDLHDLGYRLAIWSAPYLSEDVTEAYAEAEANGYFLESDDINFTKFGRLMDFTDPGAVTLWQGLIKNATDIGIEGFKLDYGEDVISGYNTVKTHFNFFNGEGSETMHHYFQYFYHKTYREMLEGDAFLLNRAGCYGDQTITSVVWPGDLCATFHYHGEEGHVGGLPAAMIGNQTLSASGYPFFGSDTGGYRHFRPTKEVLLRWVQHTALSPVLQFGGAGANCNPWDFTLYEEEDDGIENVSQYDEETLAIWRDYARLHIRLFPYVYTYAVQASETGIPVTRPYGMVHPEQGHPDFQYFYGDAFTVAPVHRAEDERTVLIPPGRWLDWFDRTPYEGPGEVTLSVALDRLPLLVREGAIVPMLRETVDTLAPAGAPGVDSYADDPGVLTVRVFPGPEATAFDVVLGPTLGVVPEGTGYRFEYGAIVPAFTGVRFEIDTLRLPGEGAEATVTGEGGTALEAVDASALATCSGCYHRDGESGWLTVVPESSEGAFVVEFPQ